MLIFDNIAETCLTSIGKQFILPALVRQIRRVIHFIRSGYLSKQLLTFSLAAVMSLAFCVGQSEAELIITLKKSGADNVEATFSGTGVIGADPGANLDLLNFTGSPFVDASAQGTFTAVNLDLKIKFFDVNDGNTAKEIAYDDFQINNVGAGVTDVTLHPSAPNPKLMIGDAYSASGTSILTGLSFSKLNLGTYSGTAGDTAAFGGVQLITAVPEPTSFVMFGLALVGFTRRRR